MFDDDLSTVGKMLGASPKYITAKKTKDAIIKLRTSWKAYKIEFEGLHGSREAGKIDRALLKLDGMAGSHHFERRHAKLYIGEVEKAVRECELAIIEETGSNMRMEKKDKTVTLLRTLGYQDVIKHMVAAERKLMNDPPGVCEKLRLALEEYLRASREKRCKQPVNSGTGSQHIDYFITEGLLDEGDRKILLGYYHFLCEKGPHATKSRKRCDQEDARFAFDQYLDILEFLEKNGCS